MANLSPQYWNPVVSNVTDRLVMTIDNLYRQTMALGYPPFTEPPTPDIRYAIYTMRAGEQWHVLARTDPSEALDQVKDFANMARRRGEPDAALPAARAVLAVTGMEQHYVER